MDAESARASRADNEENIRETKRVPHLIYQARTRSQKQQNERKVATTMSPQPPRTAKANGNCWCS
jgi:hypothetical protein